MNRLPTVKRVRILDLLVEGMSLRGISRVVGVSVNTVTKLLVDAGAACGEHHSEHVRGITGRRHIQCDETWAYVYAKQKNVAEAKSPPPGAGHLWTWTAIDEKSKLILSYLISSGRDIPPAVRLMKDIAGRLKRRPVIKTDHLDTYEPAIRWVFGRDADHVAGGPGVYVERQNLTMRMSMRRCTRKTNGFSKRTEKHWSMLNLYFTHYNWCRIHGTIRCTPAMAAGLTSRLRDTEWIVGLVDRRILPATA